MLDQKDYYVAGQAIHERPEEINEEKLQFILEQQLITRSSKKPDVYNILNAVKSEYDSDEMDFNGVVKQCFKRGLFNLAFNIGLDFTERLDEDVVKQADENYLKDCLRQHHYASAIELIEMRPFTSEVLQEITDKWLSKIPYADIKKLLNAITGKFKPSELNIDALISKLKRQGKFDEAKILRKELKKWTSKPLPSINTLEKDLDNKNYENIAKTIVSYDTYTVETALTNLLRHNVRYREIKPILEAVSNNFDEEALFDKLVSACIGQGKIYLAAQICEDYDDISIEVSSKVCAVVIKEGLRNKDYEGVANIIDGNYILSEDLQPVVDNKLLTDNITYAELKIVLDALVNDFEEYDREGTIPFDTLVESSCVKHVPGRAIKLCEDYPKWISPEVKSKVLLKRVEEELDQGAYRTASILISNHSDFILTDDLMDLLTYKLPKSKAKHKDVFNLLDAVTDSYGEQDISLNVLTEKFEDVRKKSLAKKIKSKYSRYFTL